jgi:hypothetical protein
VDGADTNLRLEDRRQSASRIGAPEAALPLRSPERGARVALGEEPLRSTSPLVVQGTCYAIFAYELGFSVDLDAAERLVTSLTQREVIRHQHRAPTYFRFQPPPLRVTRPAEPFRLSGFTSAGSVDALVFDFGAASISYAIPLQGPLDALLDLSNALYDNEELLGNSRQQVQSLLEAIRPAVGKPRIGEMVEDYVIYQFELPGAPDARGLLEQQGALLAGVLRSDRGPLSEQEVQEALSQRITYRPDDLAIVDWNGALLVGRDTDDLRSVLEFANVELLELRYLDHQLDQALDESARTLARRSWRTIMSPASDLRRIAELQTEGALLFESINNSLKLLGDQYLARLYRMASQRSHANEWDASILRKLETLESIYQKLAERRSNRRMEVLEWIIILLIAISIGLPFLPWMPGYH